jgi:hypothetical protein
MKCCEHALEAFLSFLQDSKMAAALDPAEVDVDDLAGQLVSMLY